MFTPSKIHTGVTVAVVALASTGGAHASGYAVPELSTAGVGTANALVANPKERGAAPYNPAAIAFHERSWLSLGGLLIAPDFSVETASGSHDGTGADVVVAPMIQAAVRLDDRWSAGLAVNAPFGLETRWDPGTFPALTGNAQIPFPPPDGPPTTIPLSAQPTDSKLEIVGFSPALTYAVNPELALSAGADIYWAKSASLDSTLTELEGDGLGVGFNLSALYVQDRFSAGLNFHSAATVEIDGTFSALNSTLVAIHGATGGAAGLPPSQTAELDLDLPWRLQLGVRYALTPRLAVEVDWTRIGWSEFDEIEVTGDLAGATLLRDTNDWDDSNAYRLGATYELVPERTQLRFGYSYDETGQGDSHFSPRIPDNDRHLFSAGATQRLGDGWQLELGYMYVLFTDRDVRASRPFTGGGEINGTSAIDGDYDADAHLVGLEISKAFDLF